MYGIKGGISFIGCWVCMDVLVMGDDMEDIDREDWSEEEEVLLRGGDILVMVSDVVVFLESRWIRFAIPDGIAIDG